MNQDMTCRGMKYEVGKTYHVDEEIILCKNGLHFCKDLNDVFMFYSRDESRFFEVEAPTEKTTSDGVKAVTSELTIARELTQVEVNRIVYGKGNGNGYGKDYDFSDDNGYGDGDGYGYGDGNGYGDGDGYGKGYDFSDGYGNGYGDGYGCGYGDGDGYGNGDDNGNIQRIMCFK